MRTPLRPPPWIAGLGALALAVGAGCVGEAGDSSGSLAALNRPGDAAAAPGDGPVAPALNVEPAGLVALKTNQAVVFLGSESSVTTDRALANGDVRLGSQAFLRGDVRSADDVDLEHRARIDGDVTAAGEIRRGRGARIDGAETEGASVSLLVFPSATTFAGQLPGSFGADAPSIVLRDRDVRVLPAGGRRVRRISLGDGARLVVPDNAKIEVLEELRLAPRARIEVSGEGHLTLLAHGHVDVARGAGIVQRDKDDPLGLVVILDSHADLDLSPDADLGPALLYAPELVRHSADTIRLASFRGGLVVPRLEVRHKGKLHLSDRGLRCAFDPLPPLVSITTPAEARVSVAPGTRRIAIAGTASDAVSLEAVTLTDARGSRRLPVAPNGRFSADAHLRSTGETVICVRARDCAGNLTESCIAVGFVSGLDFVITQPLPGQVVPGSSVSIRGRVTRGRLASVSAAGQAGRLLGTAEFIVDNVPLSPGVNVITVTGQGPDGTATRRITVSSGALRVIPVELSLTMRADGRDSVTLIRRQPAQLYPVPPRAKGRLSLRVMDAGGVELYRAEIPNTGRPHHEDFQPDGTVSLALDLDETRLVRALIPEIPAAAALIFSNEQGQPIGQVSWP